MSSSEKLFLGSIHSWTWREKDLRGLLEGLLRWKDSQRVTVGGFILLHAQDVAKELELSRDDGRQKTAAASEIVNTVI